MRRRNIDKLIIIIYVIDLSKFNEFSSSTFNDDLNLFEKDKHTYVQTFSLNLFFIFLSSILFVNFSLLYFRYDDYDSNVIMIKKTKHDIRIIAKSFNYKKIKHDMKIIAKNFNHEKTKYDTKIIAEDFNYLQKHEFLIFNDNDKNDNKMNDKVFDKNDKIFNKDDEIFNKNDEIFDKNNKIFDKNNEIFDRND